MAEENTVPGTSVNTKYLTGMEPDRPSSPNSSRSNRRAFPPGAPGTARLSEQTPAISWPSTLTSNWHLAEKGCDGNDPQRHRYLWGMGGELLLPSGGPPSIGSATNPHSTGETSAIRHDPQQSNYRQIHRGWLGHRRRWPLTKKRRPGGRISICAVVETSVAASTTGGSVVMLPKGGGGAARNQPFPRVLGTPDVERSGAVAAGRPARRTCGRSGRKGPRTAGVRRCGPRATAVRACDALGSCSDRRAWLSASLQNAKRKSVIFRSRSPRQRGATSVVLAYSEGTQSPALRTFTEMAGTRVRKERRVGIRAGSGATGRLKRGRRAYAGRRFPQAPPEALRTR